MRLSFAHLRCFGTCASLVTSIVLLFSCSNEPNTSSDHSVGKHLELQFRDSLSLMPIGAVQIGFSHPQLFDSDIPDREFSVIKSMLARQGIVTLDVESVVLFTTGDVGASHELSLNDVVGVGTYRRTNSARHFSLYCRRGTSTGYFLSRDLTCRSGSVSANTIGLVASRTLRDLGHSVLAAVVFTPSSRRLSHHIDIVGDNIELNARVWLSSAVFRRQQHRSSQRLMAVAPGNVGRGCEVWLCRDKSGNECGHQGREGWICTHTWRICTIAAYRTDNDLQPIVGSDTFETALDTMHLRAFRDQSLKQTAWGAKIISYYYFLSQVIDTSNVPLSLKARAVATLYKFNLATISKLMDESSPAEAQLMSASLRAELIELLASFRDVSTEPLYRELIDDLIQDVEAYGNLSVGSFRSVVRNY